MVKVHVRQRAGWGDWTVCGKMAHTVKVLADSSSSATCPACIRLLALEVEHALELRDRDMHCSGCKHTWRLKGSTLNCPTCGLPGHQYGGGLPQELL